MCEKLSYYTSFIQKRYKLKKQILKRINVEFNNLYQLTYNVMNHLHKSFYNDIFTWNISSNTNI